MVSNYKIFSIPLQTLQDIYPEFTASFFDNLLSNVVFGKNTERSWLINNNLAIDNVNNLQIVNIYNTFAQLSQSKCNLLQITKI